MTTPDVSASNSTLPLNDPKEPILDNLFPAHTNQMFDNGRSYLREELSSMDVKHLLRLNNAAIFLFKSQKVKKPERKIEIIRLLKDLDVEELTLVNFYVGEVMSLHWQQGNVSDNGATLRILKGIQLLKSAFHRTLEEEFSKTKEKMRDIANDHEIDLCNFSERFLEECKNKKDMKELKKLLKHFKNAPRDPKDDLIERMLSVSFPKYEDADTRWFQQQNNLNATLEALELAGKLKASSLEQLEKLTRIANKFFTSFSVNNLHERVKTARLLHQIPEEKHAYYLRLATMFTSLYSDFDNDVGECHTILDSVYHLRELPEKNQKKIVRKIEKTIDREEHTESRRITSRIHEECMYAAKNARLIRAVIEARTSSSAGSSSTGS